MSYTVKKLAKLSGVSPRTLRFYDEIGLLKPAYYGDNTYRYYEEEQLLMLQQILFFRELGFPLNDIQGFISRPDFDKIETLIVHKSTLQKSLEKTETLIKTINKTLSHLRGETKMHGTEIYEGLHSKIEKAIEEFSREHKKALIDDSVMTQLDIEVMEKAEEKLKDWKLADFATYQADGEEILKAFVIAIEKNLEPNSLEVQSLVNDHYQWSTHMSGMITKEAYYNGYSTPSACSPHLPDYYRSFHPKLMDYLLEAMKVFAQCALS